jgi:hypothetical protein
MPQQLRPLQTQFVPHYATLNDGERHQLEETAWEIVRHFRWEAAWGFALTLEMQVAIAAQAALLVLEIGLDSYHDVGAIIVHETTMTYSRVSGGDIEGTVTEGPANSLGEAHMHGPLLLAWDAIVRDSHHPDRGHNVVLHEFAHKLDMLDHSTDGTPPLPAGDERARWIEVCTREFEALRQGEAEWPLDDYGATNPAEFFAVATETFFLRPLDLAEAKVDLYDVLRSYYQQDPAARFGRAVTPQ